jgi:hypothetical protein
MRRREHKSELEKKGGGNHDGKQFNLTQRLVFQLGLVLIPVVVMGLLAVGSFWDSAGRSPPIRWRAEQEAIRNLQAGSRSDRDTIESFVRGIQHDTLKWRNPATCATT